MLDSYPELRYLSFAQRVRLLARLATRRASTAMKLPVARPVSHVRPTRRRSRTPRVSYQPPADVRSPRLCNASGKAPIWR